jgi:hypothetical protein
MGREVESQGTKKAGQGSPSLFQIARVTATKGVGSRVATLQWPPRQTPVSNKYERR